jgi:sulfur-oxidizing protein SoxY
MTASGAPDRRQTLQAIAAVTAFGAWPLSASATPEAVDAEVRNRFGDRKTVPGPLRLDLPDVAENGQAVPLGVEADSPMTAADHVKAIHILAENNPLPNVASFYFTPASAKAAVAIRMRLAETQVVVAIAETSTGALWRAEKLVKVTVGGCGG